MKNSVSDEPKVRHHTPDPLVTANLFAAREAARTALPPLEIDETSRRFKEAVRKIQAARDLLPEVVDDYV